MLLNLPTHEYMLPNQVTVAGLECNGLHGQAHTAGQTADSTLLGKKLQLRRTHLSSEASTHTHSDQRACAPTRIPEKSLE